MLDFTSALYLGIRMDPRPNRFGRGPGSTTGKPAALESPPSAKAWAKSLRGAAGMRACGPHFHQRCIFFFDLFEEDSVHEGVRLYVDSGAYPNRSLGRCGTLRGAGRITADDPPL